MKRSYRRQTGAVLFVALIFLLVLTMLALAASSSSIMQERMTGGMRNRQLSMVAADTTLRGGERYLWKLNFAGQQPFVPCVDAGQTNCVYESFGSTHPVAQRFRTDRSRLAPGADGAREYDQTLESLAGGLESAQITARPRYIIEEIGKDVPPGFVNTGDQRGSYMPGGPSKAGERVLYRITARSYGGTDATLSIMESVYSSANLTDTGFNPNNSGP